MLDAIREIEELTRSKADQAMRTAHLCGRVRGLLEAMDTYLESMERTPGDPHHIDSFRHVRDRLDDALNQYLDLTKPF